MIKPIIGMLKRAHEVVADMQPVRDSLKALQKTHERIQDVRCVKHPERSWFAVKNGKTLCKECYDGA